ncbi:hypothetical protein ACTI_51250 [Actinoplanes sp. OR16]|uniref:hypothetical protein n=1 Tax=Actinoplanes sp. OR16 TaxID=946334 RepID=UPI000F6FEFFD|nr:hypothetical protein [Actinoplanes sp. OR16]BBH68440.1 hypothetical protein ACTI_51250 [Actinoplanes sp. OR16]
MAGTGRPALQEDHSRPPADLPCPAELVWHCLTDPAEPAGFWGWEGMHTSTTFSDLGDGRTEVVALLSARTLPDGRSLPRS